MVPAWVYVGAPRLDDEKIPARGIRKRDRIMYEMAIQYDYRYFNTVRNIGKHVIVDDDETMDKWTYLDDNYGCLDAPDLMPAGSCLQAHGRWAVITTYCKTYETMIAR